MNVKRMLLGVALWFAGILANIRYEGTDWFYYSQGLILVGISLWALGLTEDDKKK